MADSYGQTYRPQSLRALETPEGVNLSLEIASVGARLGAFLLDMLMVYGMIIVLWIVLGLTASATKSESADKFLVGFMIFTTFILRNFWFILFEMGPRGATPGKRVAGLRVIARGGGTLEARSIVARNLLRDVELFLPLTFMFGAEGLAILLGVTWTLLFFFFPLFNKDRMRAGDLLAGTWVIRVPKRDAGYDLTAVQDAAAEETRFKFTDDQLAAYGAFELQTLESVLRGSDEAAMQVVAETIRNKIGWPYEYDDHAFLSAYYKAVRARLERGMLFGKKKKDKFDL